MHEPLGSTIRAIFLQEGAMKKERVKDWMSHNVITIQPECPLADAYQLMTNSQIRRLPVVENGRLVGIVTLGDLRGARPSDIGSLSLWEINFMIAQLTTVDIMTPHPITITPDEPVAQAAILMLENAIGCLPVINQQQELIGIITESDIFRLVVHNWKNAQDDPTEPFAHYGNK
jgi:acetoin utilization protein AcuB